MGRGAGYGNHFLVTPNLSLPKWGSSSSPSFCLQHYLFLHSMGENWEGSPTILKEEILGINPSSILSYPFPFKHQNIKPVYHGAQQPILASHFLTYNLVYWTCHTINWCHSNVARVYQAPPLIWWNQENQCCLCGSILLLPSFLKRPCLLRCLLGQKNLYRLKGNAAQDTNNFHNASTVGTSASWLDC